MDSNTQSSISTAASSSRKRERENETPSQRHKREKAAERQRRKRERDRNNNSNATPGTGSSVSAPIFPQAGEHHSRQVSQALPPDNDLTGQEMSPEERARRDRVRAAARERQRKHRALVKDRKMRELGIDMGNDVMEVHYRVNGDGQYQEVLAHELQHHPHGGIIQEPPFPHGQPPGHAFATTLLLSCSYTPRLKEDLLRALSMTNEELTSLHPIIAEAWDRWDHQRRLHYAQQAADAARSPGSSHLPASSTSYAPDSHAPENTVSTSYASERGHQQNTSDFRNRFQRSLTGPTPFRTFTADTQATTPTSSSASNGSGPPSDGIDPHLSEGRHAESSDLGRAGGEAENVVGRLERR